MKGLCDRLIRANLSDGSIDFESIEEGVARKYLKAISLADYLLDGYGLDTMSVGDTIAFLMDCYERGLTGKEMTNGLDLQFGDLDAWMAAVNAAGKGEGNLGKLVANGVLKAAEETGGDSIDFAPQVKGLELPAYGPRSGEGIALSYARRERGADHLKPWVFHKEWLTAADRVDPFTLDDKPSLIKADNEISAMLPKYYEVCGWDENGVPTPEKLCELGPGFVMEELKEAGAGAEAARAA